MKICNVCGQEVEKLTHEHIPPKAFGNVGRGYLLGSDENGCDWFTDIIQGKNDYRNSKGIDYEKRYLKDGQTKKTVCVECNSKAGEVLVNDFLKISKLIEKAFVQHSSKGCGELHVNIEEIGTKYTEAYKNFLKLIIFQFLCIQPCESDHTKEIRDLYHGKNNDKFILDIVVTDFYSMNIHGPTMALLKEPSIYRNFECISYGYIKATLKSYSVGGDKGRIKVNNFSIQEIREIDNKLDIFNYDMNEPILYFKIKNSGEEDPLVHEKIHL